jgi:hypothetical protein
LSSVVSRAVRKMIGASVPRSRSLFVEDQDLRAELLGGGESRAPVAGRRCLEARVAERHRHQLGDVLLVVDDEDPRGAIRHASMIAEKPGKFLRIGQIALDWA